MILFEVIDEGEAMVKVLIIEDDPLILDMYHTLFSSEGYKVFTATNGEEGLASARSTKPAIILLDIMMPKVNGLELLKRLKALPELASIPVLVLTNVIGLGVADGALQAGAIKCVIKSDYNPSEIVSMVRDILADHTTHESGSRHTSRSPSKQ